MFQTNTIADRWSHLIVNWRQSATAQSSLSDPFRELRIFKIKQTFQPFYEWSFRNVNSIFAFSVTHFWINTQKLFCLNSWVWRYWQRLLDVFNDIFNITPTITLHSPNSHPPSFPLFRLDIDICWCIYKICCIQPEPPLRFWQ